MSLSGQSILLTGGTGSFGNAFTRHVLDHCNPRRVIIFSRDEVKQAEMAARFNDDRLRFFVGDIRDESRLRRAFREVNAVIHAAALKRIEVGFYNPDEMVKTNVLGSMNVIEAATASGVDRVVFLSSDKAWQPCSAYGQSKALAETLFLAANNMHGEHGPRFSVCRYGNVWGSRGSVMPTWRAMLENGADTVPVTDPDCTRFFMTLSQAVQLVLDTLNTMPAEIAIPELPAYRLGDLAEAMGARMDVRGLGSFEKQHEGMRAGLTSDAARRMTVGELREALAA